MASLLYIESAKQNNSDLAAIHCELTLPGHGISVLNRIVHAKTGRELTKFKLVTVLRMLENGAVGEDGKTYMVPEKTEIRLCTSDRYLIDCVREYFTAQQVPEDDRPKRFRNGRECKRLWDILSARGNKLTYEDGPLLAKMMQSEASEHLRTHTSK